MTQNAVDYNVSTRDISGLQYSQLPWLLTNFAVDISNSWNRYVETIHFDRSTGLAVMTLGDPTAAMAVDPLSAAVGALNYIARLNAETGCADGSAYSFLENRTGSDDPCWIPVVAFGSVQEHWDAFKNAIVDVEHPPALLIDNDGHDRDLYAEPVLVKRTWISSFGISDRLFYHHRLTLDAERRTIVAVNVTLADLRALPEELKDDDYARHIRQLRLLADVAAAENPVVGRSLAMPVQRDDEQNYFRCKAGECESGQLFTDALQWWTLSDFSFITSGGIRGPGWEAGDVRISNLWDVLPFPNTVCQGVMSGISVFKLFNFSTSVATFEGADTEQGDLL